MANAAASAEDQLKSQMASEFIAVLITVRGSPRLGRPLLSLRIQALEDNCFPRCIKKPGTKLEKADEVASAPPNAQRPPLCN